MKDVIREVQNRLSDSGFKSSIVSIEYLSYLQSDLGDLLEQKILNRDFWDPIYNYSADFVALVLGGFTLGVFSLFLCSIALFWDIGAFFWILSGIGVTLLSLFGIGYIVHRIRHFLKRKKALKDPFFPDEKLLYERIPAFNQRLETAKLLERNEMLSISTVDLSEKIKFSGSLE